jgi:hypothetical protein
MIEGTSNPFGSIWVANLARKTLESRSLLLDNRQHTPAGHLAVGVQSWNLEALVFSTNFRMGFDITDFQAVLPKNYIHRVIPGEPIYDFMETWKRAAAETAHAKAFGVRQWFTASTERLAQCGYDVSINRKWLSKGYLIWNNP